MNLIRICAASIVIAAVLGVFAVSGMNVTEHSPDEMLSPEVHRGPLLHREEEPPRREEIPEPSLCEQVVDHARAVAGGDNPEPPRPVRVLYEDELDPDLGDPHPLGTLTGYTIRVWPASHPSDEAVTFTVLHELGHVVDMECLDNPTRDLWREERGFTHPWRYHDVYRAPDEDFADSFAVCLSEDPRWWTVDGSPPDEEACATLAGLVTP